MGNIITRTLQKVLQARIDYFKRCAYAYLAIGGVTLSVGILVLFASLTALLFAGFAAAYGLNEWLDSTYQGFLYVAGGYVVVAAGCGAAGTCYVKHKLKSIGQTSK